MAKVLLVNSRGRVTDVPADRVEALKSEGFAEAPKDAFAGQYIPEMDVMAQPVVEKPVVEEPEPQPVVEEKKPKRKRRRRRKKA